MKPANRMSEIPPSGTLKVLGLAKKLEREGKKIIHLESGQPDFNTPDHIQEAAVKALADGLTRYTPSAGTQELREAVAENVSSSGVEAKPEDVLITPGTKHAIYCAMVAVLDPSDEVIIPDPCWTYESIVKLADGIPVYVETPQEDGFKLKPENLQNAITKKSRLLILNYPSNPTGATMMKDELKAITEIAVDNDLWVLTDEIYDKLTYDTTHVSPATLPGMRERTIYTNGFSKTYAMTGWRLGYSVSSPELVEEMVKIQQATTSCATSFVQAAGVAALKNSQDCVKEMFEAFKKRRDVIVDGLNSIEGVDCAKPEGAFYVFPKIEGFKSQELCEKLLYEAGVASVPGSAFGPHGEGHVRFSYSNSEENIKKGIENIRKVVEG